MTPMPPRVPPDAVPGDPSPVALRERIALAAILLVALLVRLPGLGTSLWYDEVMYTGAAFAQPDTLSFLLWKDVHPPVYTLVLLAWTGLAGDSEVAVRLPSLAFGLASLWLFWFIARRWQGPRTALVAAALLALSPPHIWYSNENKVNMLLLLLTLGAVWLYWRAAETGKRRDWAAATVVLIVATYTHAYAVPVAAAIFLWLASRAAAEPRLFKPLLASGMLAAIAVLPLAVLKLAQIDELDRNYLRQLSLPEVYKLLLVWLPSGNTLRTVNPYEPFARLAAQPWPYFLLDAFFAVLLVRGAAVQWRAARGNGWTAPGAPPPVAAGARLVLLWLVVPVVFTLAGSLASPHFYIERNLIVVLPPFLLLLAAGADVRSPRLAGTLATGALLVLAVAATVSLLFVKTEVWTVYKYKPDWRALAGYFGAEVRANGALRVFVTTGTNEFFYYGPRVVLADAPPGADREVVVADVCGGDIAKVPEAIAQEAWSTFYLLHNTTWSGCWDPAWRAFSTDPRFRVVDTRRFKGIIAYKFSR